MICIELDIFSGMYNPTWSLTAKEENDFIDRILADPSLTAPPTTAGSLGYKGFIVYASENARTRLMSAGLPSYFYLNAKKSTEAQSSLLHSKEAGKETKDDILQIAEDAIPSANKAIQTLNKQWYEYWATHTDSEPASSPKKENKIAAEPDLPEVFQENSAAENSPNCGVLYGVHYNDVFSWNTSYYLKHNNCYSFATFNRNLYRNCARAQPGHKSRFPARINLNDWTDVVNRSVRDGLWTTCPPGPHFLVALVLAPGQDYHWYRLCTNGIWCHKPGCGPATYLDASSRVITNPQTCNRNNPGGINYSVFCGYMYVPYNLRVSGPPWQKCGSVACP
jgi:hypothetical protein